MKVEQSQIFTMEKDVRRSLEYNFPERLVEIAGLRKGKKKVIDVTKEFGMAGAIQESRINCDNLLEKVREFSGLKLHF